MNEKKYVVPEGMLKAVIGEYRESAEEMLEAALRWQAENPVVPTEQQWQQMLEDSPKSMTGKELAVEWQRRMYLAPEPEVCPVEKALRDSRVTISNDWLCPECQRVHEAMLFTNSQKLELEPYPHALIYRQFHKLWTASVRQEGYVKEDWNDMNKFLNRTLWPEGGAK